MLCKETAQQIHYFALPFGVFK